MIETIQKWSGVVALVAILFTWAVPSPTQQFGGANCNGGKCTDYDAVNVSDGYYVDDTQIITGTGAITSTTGSFSGLLTTDGGLLNSYTNSTSTTATAYTLTQADILNYQTVLLTPNTASITITFPASSSLSSLVPAAGDRAEQCWINSTSTAGTNITFAAGTGIDLEVASSTDNTFGGNALVIGPNNSTCLQFIRQKATASSFDITVQLLRFVNAD